MNFEHLYHLAKLPENKKQLREYGLNGDVDIQKKVSEEILDEAWKKFIFSNKNGNKQAENFVIWNKEGKEDLAEKFALFVEGFLAGRK